MEYQLCSSFLRKEIVMDIEEQDMKDIIHLYVWMTHFTFEQ